MIWLYNHVMMYCRAAFIYVFHICLNFRFKQGKKYQLHSRKRNTQRCLLQQSDLKSSIFPSYTVLRIYRIPANNKEIVVKCKAGIFLCKKNKKYPWQLAIFFFRGYLFHYGLFSDNFIYVAACDTKCFRDRLLI